MTEPRCRWGIIGPGRIAHRFAAALDAVNGAELTAVASRSRERADHFASKYNARKAYDTYEALAADPDVDAIYVATPHSHHQEHATLALEAGKPVLCEKPLTANAKQAQALIELARSRDLFLMEALWTRFLPIYEVIRSWLVEGLIGDLTLLTSSFGYRVPFDANGRLFDPELAGGVLLDMGVYNVAISQWVCRANAVSFAALSRLGQTGVDELTAVTLTYGSGVVSQFTCNIRATTVNDFTIYGTDGHIRIGPTFWDASTSTLTRSGNAVTETRSHRLNGFEYQIAEAIRCIGEGLTESPIMSHADTLANMDLMDRIRDRVGLRYPFES